MGWESGTGEWLKSAPQRTSYRVAKNREQASSKTRHSRRAAICMLLIAQALDARQGKTRKQRKSRGRSRCVMDGSRDDR